MFVEIAFIPSKSLPLATGSARRPGTLMMECNSHCSLADTQCSVPVAPPQCGRRLGDSKTVRKRRSRILRVPTSGWSVTRAQSPRMSTSPVRLCEVVLRKVTHHAEQHRINTHPVCKYVARRTMQSRKWKPGGAFRCHTFPVAPHRTGRHRSWEKPVSFASWQAAGGILYQCRRHDPLVTPNGPKLKQGSIPIDTYIYRMI
jgi:hypothetical protein